MKILLAFPETSRSKYDFAGIIDDEPYDLECLMAYLKGRGHEVRLWDGQINKDFRGNVKEFSPDFVYFCGRTRQENFIKEYCAFCKTYSESKGYNLLKDLLSNSLSIKKKIFGEKDKTITTIVGGIHASLNPERFFEDEVDYVVTTYDPSVVADIVEGKDPSQLKGICYRNTISDADEKQSESEVKNEANKIDDSLDMKEIKEDLLFRNNDDNDQIKGEWKKIPAAPFDIKKMPWADRTNFYINMERYCYLELRPCAIIRTAFCCPYSCAFCYRNRLNCGKYSARDIKDVVDEIESIECENIYIIDDDFLVGPQRLQKFVQLIKERNIKKKFVCFGRADFIVKHPEIIKLLSEIGFYYILTGLEYIENKRLSDTNKRSGVNTNGNAIRILHENGIHMMGMFITDLDFKKKDFKNLYRWIKHFKLKHVAVSIYTPEMCLENFADYKDRLITTDPGDWDYLHVVAEPTHISVKKYYFYYHILLIKIFLRAKRQGIYDFIDYKMFIKSFVKNMFKFGG